MLGVIPGPNAARSPESIITGSGYGFRVRHFVAPRNDEENTASTHHLPGDGFAAAVDQRALVEPGDFDFFRRRPWHLFERDSVVVGRHPIVLGAIERGKGFQLIERALLLEDLGVAFDGDRGVEHARDTAD